MPKGKRERREKGYEDKGSRSTYVQAIYDVAGSEDLINKIAKDAARSKFLTPYMVAEKYGIQLGAAKKILRYLAERGVLKLYSPGRRVPIYVPASKSSR